MPTKKAGSSFLLSICASALSSTPESAVRCCTKIGTVILYIETVMECGPCAVIRMGAQCRAFSGKVDTGFPSENATTQGQASLRLGSSDQTAIFKSGPGGPCRRSSIDLPDLSIN